LVNVVFQEIDTENERTIVSGTCSTVSAHPFLYGLVPRPLRHHGRLSRPSPVLSSVCTYDPLTAAAQVFLPTPSVCCWCAGCSTQTMPPNESDTSPRDRTQNRCVTVLRTPGRPESVLSLETGDWGGHAMHCARGQRNINKTRALRLGVASDSLLTTLRRQAENVGASRPLLRPWCHRTMDRCCRSLQSHRQVIGRRRGRRRSSATLEPNSFRSRVCPTNRPEKCAQANRAPIWREGGTAGRSTRAARNRQNWTLHHIGDSKWHWATNAIHGARHR